MTASANWVSFHIIQFSQLKIEPETSVWREIVLGDIKCKKCVLALDKFDRVTDILITMNHEWQWDFWSTEIGHTQNYTRGKM